MGGAVWKGTLTTSLQRAEAGATFALDAGDTCGPSPHLRRKRDAWHAASDSTGRAEAVPLLAASPREESPKTLAGEAVRRCILGGSPDLKRGRRQVRGGRARPR